MGGKNMRCECGKMLRSFNKSGLCGGCLRKVKIQGYAFRKKIKLWKKKKY
jgi:hypothetical protein